MFAGKKSAQIREILISESAWEEMTCLFAPSLGHSLAEVDGEYFSEINKSIQKSARWIVALYKGEEKSGSLEDYDVRASNISYVLYEDI
ncbi:hypothetical protein QYQ35_10230 [Klebsiella pneumoniae]|uniref:hypothetical protein n=1 Tax=Klebsiella pneumoniae TaxID=573 RepID=UPI0013C37010|nr:hypothetical protein [Klebsiella pneumoniae]MBF2725882.1 hypothetical protein [Klebsiella pneumoniae]MBF2730175.1 hypothetical protein [Klebsiella pneumoniae]MBQ5035446.1 hypothetical protein [Klebsiella pneumoniae]QPP94127.1 hypothetical protein I5M55_12220 [Klebsiella pneumoniae]QPP99579.1 hypothetical protein I5M63_05540 [Klebsiella pneumoniae]